MKLNIARLCLALFGQGLIFVIFLLLLPLSLFGMELSVLWLDLVVVSIVYWIWVLATGIAPVDKSDASQRGIGALGIRLYAASTYTLFALGFMVIAMCVDIDGSVVPFPWQITIQAVIFFGFLCSIYASDLASRKTAQVYADQREMKAGKADIKYALSKVVAAAEDNNASDDVKEQLRRLTAEMRFMSPSASCEATDADMNIVNECSRLAAALLNPEMNQPEISKGVAQLERYIQRRKQV